MSADAASAADPATGAVAGTATQFSEARATVLARVLPMLGRGGSQVTEGKETGEEGPVRLFVGVLTSGQNAEARAAVRSTWGKNPGLHRVMFFAAKPRDPQVPLQ